SLSRKTASRLHVSSLPLPSQRNGALVHQSIVLSKLCPAKLPMPRLPKSLKTAKFGPISDRPISLPLWVRCSPLPAAAGAFAAGDLRRRQCFVEIDAALLFLDLKPV